jgi:hypothetical protein
MKRSRTASGFAIFANFGLLIFVGAITGCAGGQPVTPEALEQAKQLWKKAGIQNYELEWTVSGAQTNHYLVQVHDALAQQIELIQPDGARRQGKIADTRYYTVDGLFLTIADELAMLKSEHPFDQPAGTQVVMRFDPDPKLGYPRWYHRDVMGTSRSVAITVVKLVPQAETAK